MNEITDEELTLIQLKLEGKTILYGDGVHDDSEAFSIWASNAGIVYFRDGTELGDFAKLPRGRYYIPAYTDNTVSRLNNPTGYFQKRYADNCVLSNKPFTQ